jgi:hypothetical protein
VAGPVALPAVACTFARHDSVGQQRMHGCHRARQRVEVRCHTQRTHTHTQTHTWAVVPVVAVELAPVALRIGAVLAVVPVQPALALHLAAAAAQRRRVLPAAHAAGRLAGTGRMAKLHASTARGVMRGASA